jgi:NADPH:quinone reductase-like Zn-dependent oxidoreductase
LRLEEVDRPVLEADEVLVRVRAAAVNPYDWHFMTGLPYLSRLQFGLREPRVHRLGADLAGRVEAIGDEVTRFRPGDEIFGEVQAGGFAEYACVSERSAALQPANLTFEQAAAVPMAGLTALQGLRDHGRIEPGQKALINGAAGGVGTFAVQIARSLGAEVTGVCSTRNVDMVRSIGADQVVDYTRDDFTRSPQRHDLMFDLVGNRSLSECRRVVKPKGVYLASYGKPENLWLGPLVRLLGMMALSPLVSQRLRPFVTQANREDLQLLRELIEAGEVTPVIDRTYSLGEVPDAIRYLEEGHARGKVVITV